MSIKKTVINTSAKKIKAIKSTMVMWCCLLLSLFSIQSAWAASGHTVLSATSVKFYVTDAPWADVHYTINGANQQNIRMTASGTNHEYILNAATNSVIRYFYTIGNNSGGANDTAWVQFTLTGTTNPQPGGVARVYQHCSYGGTAVGLAAGNYTLSQLQALGVRNDDISSVQVNSGYEIVLYQNDNFGGTSVTKSANDDCLVNDNFNDAASSIIVRATNTTNPGTPGTANGTHKRLKIINGCGDPMWVQWLTAPGINFSGPNRHRLASLNSFIEYDIPDKGLPSMRFWPGFGCDANGHNCRVGASGGPANLGFTCPAGGCAPPIDSKFEASFGCIPGVTDAQCVQNPSAPGTPLGRGDWWNNSFVDGYTTPMKVIVKGNCPVGPQPAPVFGPGGPPGGIIDCSTIRISDCPTNENLSTDGRYPALANVNLIATNPITGAQAGCYSPAAKLTYRQWPSSTPVYNPADPQAQMYTCPTPPVSPEQCMAGPADRTKYRNMVHSHCDTYAYAYDDGVGLSSCPAATNLVYEVTFYCPR
ncbi:MAG TPA: hypothetical protein VIM59_02795 [Cellvibrio sp.]